MQKSSTGALDIGAAIGPYDEFCDGYVKSGNGDNDSGISVFKMSTGVVAESDDSILEVLVSRNRAEASDAYVGQINTIDTSSISWLDGAIWGFDIARHDSLNDGTLKPIMRRQCRDGRWIPIFPITPLLDAGKALFGSAGAKRFPLMPGSHVECATREVVVKGPVCVWTAVALSIPRGRGTIGPSLLLEDVGHGVFDEPRSEQESLHHEFRLLHNLVDSAIACGDDLAVGFNEIYVGVKSAWVPEGHVGCALSCVPQIALARNAAPDPLDGLFDISLSEWESLVGPRLPNRRG
jgi:histidine decarboxylase